MAVEDHQNKRPRIDENVTLEETEDNNQNKRAKLILDEVYYEDTEHTFYLDLPPYSQKDKLIKFFKDSKKDWPSVDFSFSDGNLTGVENLFTLYLNHWVEDGEEELLNVSVSAKLKHFPWKFNEKLGSTILNFARISFVNFDDSSSDVFTFYDDGVKEGFLSCTSEDAFLNWDSNYDGIKITINVSKRGEGSVEIVPSKPMMALTNSNVLPSKAVNTSFEKYFLSGTLSDCKVEADDKVFPAHRFVLTGISGFFERMFETEMDENQNKIWKIDDFQPAVVEEFLEYAYKGTSKNLKLAQNTEFLMDLFRMGHKYDVGPLKARCEEVLKNMINAENVVDLFQFGLDYELESLMAAAKIYFNRFKLQILPDSDRFCEFNRKYPDTIIYKLAIE